MITGGAGYLGANIISLLRGVKCKIVSLEPPAGDVREQKVWERSLTGVDVVFHLAAQTSTYAANDRPIDDQRINVLPMLMLLETCRAKGLSPVIIFSGSATETGVTKTVPVGEERFDEPATVYDLHKLMSEKYLKYYVQQGVVKGGTLRLANVYGPGPKSTSADRGVLNAMIRKALKGDDLTVYGRGKVIRDYIYVKDVAWAFLLAAARAEKLKGGPHLIGSGEGHSLFQTFSLVAERAAKVTGRRVKVVSVPAPANLSIIESRNFVADPSKMKKATGWRADYSLTKGIDETIKSFLTEQNGDDIDER